MSRIYISAAHKSSGKTAISIGLCAALQRRRLTVQAFKKGPDYIDPLWLARASGRDCYNLDFFTMQHEEIMQCLADRAHDADVSLIEGNKGLYDGLDLDGSNSNAALAALTRTPVILVLDARGMTRGIAPLILGYQAFEPGIDIAGVILNQLGGSRHESKLRSVIEHYTDARVIGAVHRDESIDIEERHLGLVPSNEDSYADDKIDRLADAVSRQVDLDALLEIAGAVPDIGIEPTPAAAPAASDIRLGIVRSPAFGFYYADDLRKLALLGAELVEIDVIQDTSLPAIDALFIGGGFPETHMHELERNTAMRSALRSAIEGGMPTYAECGGLMYLARSITWREDRAEMVGVIPGDIVMEKKPQGRGYVRLSATASHPWGAPGDRVINAHEFHYSRFNNLDKGARFAFEVRRGTGIDGEIDGYVQHNLLACYTHQRDTSNNPWAGQFIDFVRRKMATTQKETT